MVALKAWLELYVPLAAVPFLFGTRAEVVALASASPFLSKLGGALRLLVPLWVLLRKPTPRQRSPRRKLLAAGVVYQVA